jgi:hypothetical protein
MEMKSPLRKAISGSEGSKKAIEVEVIPTVRTRAKV